MKAFLIAALALSLSPALALADETPPPEPVLTPELRDSCRAAVREICQPGFPPDRARMRSCLEEKRDQFPDECRAAVQALAERRR